MEQQHMTPQQLEEANKLWNRHKKLAFDLKNIQNATRFSYYVNEQPVGIVGVDTEMLKSYITDRLLEELAASKQELLDKYNVRLELLEG